VRREKMIKHLTLVFLLSLPWMAATQTTNIVLINVDDIGYGDFGPYGQQLIATPQIDRMAHEGARFTNFYASAPVCGPSRASLLTGMHSGHVGNCGNDQVDLTAAFTTWPRLVRNNGYATAMFGKQHSSHLSGSTVLGDSPVDRGFDEFVGWLSAVDAHQHFIDGATVTPGWDRRQYLFATNDQGTITRYDIPSDRYTHNEFIEKALDFIRDHAEEPFLLYLSSTIAHAELAVPRYGSADYDSASDYGLFEQYLDSTGASIFEEFDYRGDPIYGRPNPHMTRATFAAMISRLDRDIGAILDLLTTLGIHENTLVLLTSDNGPHDEGGVDPEQINGDLSSPFQSSGGLRGFKRSLYEGGIRVPCIAWWPGTIRPGTVIDELLANYDIGPTLLEVTNSQPLQGIDGRSFYPLLIDHTQSVHEYLYFQYADQQAIRFGEWKGYRGTNLSPYDHLELYNLALDLAETVDLSSDTTYRDLIGDLKRIMNFENEGSVCPFVPFELGTVSPK
jgi:arylsulfatase A-like enzyme